MVRWVDDRARGRRPLLHHVARQPALGGGAGACGGRGRVPRRDRAEVGAQGRRRRRRRPDRGESPRRRTRRAAESAEALLDELASSGLPLVCAGGVGDVERFRRRAPRSATRACSWARASSRPRSAARARPTSGRSSRPTKPTSSSPSGITGVPVAVIDTPYIRAGRAQGGPYRPLDAPRTPDQALDADASTRCARIWQLKRASLDESGEKDYWQAGKSVAGIRAVEPAGEIVRRFAEAASAWTGGRDDGTTERISDATADPLTR